MEQKPPQISEHGSRTRLYFAVASVNLLYICTGCIMSWTSPTLPKLANILTPDQASLIGSLYSFGAAFGPLTTAICLDSLGRKATLYILGACFLISWIVLATSMNIYVMYAARIIGGLGVGGTFSSGSVFVAEFAEDSNRGALCSINQAAIALGFLIEFCVGPWTSYLTLILVSALPPIFFFITFYFIPESPYYLLIKSRKAEAVESLRWFRGNIKPTSVQKELTEMQESIRMKNSRLSGIKALFRKGPQKALLISFYLLIMQQGSGNNAIVVFAQQIFEMANILVSGSIVAIIGGVTNFFAGAMTPFIVRKFSLKSTFLCSTFGGAISLGLLSLYFYLKSTLDNFSCVSFLPILAYILYNIFYCWGCGPLPWAVIAEIIPLEVKGLSACICGIFSMLVSFAVIEIIAIFLDESGPTIVFASLFIFLALTGFGAIFIVPKTDGMSLQEINDYMETGKRPDKTSEKS